MRALYMMLHLEGCGSGPPSCVPRSVSPSMSSKTLAVQVEQAQKCQQTFFRKREMYDPLQKACNIRKASPYASLRIRKSWHKCPLSTPRTLALGFRQKDASGPAYLKESPDYHGGSPTLC